MLSSNRTRPGPDLPKIVRHHFGHCWTIYLLLWLHVFALIKFLIIAVITFCLGMERVVFGAVPSKAEQFGRALWGSCCSTQTAGCRQRIIPSTSAAEWHWRPQGEEVMRARRQPSGNLPSTYDWSAKTLWEIGHLLLLAEEMPTHPERGILRSLWKGNLKECHSSCRWSFLWETLPAS